MPFCGLDTAAVARTEDPESDRFVAPQLETAIRGLDRVPIKFQLPFSFCCERLLKACARA